MSTDTRIPAPLYAAAGAGDLAYRQLRKLPARAAELRSKVAATDLDKLRDAAMRNANVLMSNAQVAQERVAAVYADLVKRGAKIVASRSGTVETDAAGVANVVVKPASKTAAKPVKRTRSTTRK